RQTVLPTSNQILQRATIINGDQVTIDLSKCPPNFVLPIGRAIDGHPSRFDLETGRLLLAEDTVSHFHATISFDRMWGRITVRDHKSSNGTYVNGNKDRLTSNNDT